MLEDPQSTDERKFELNVSEFMVKKEVQEKHPGGCEVLLVTLMGLSMLYAVVAHSCSVS